MADPEYVKELFARYARLRQSRASREDAWKRVKPDAEDLIEVERQRVLALIRDWEIIEGHRYKPAEEDDPHATMFDPPAGLREARERFKEEKARQDAKSIDPDRTKEYVLKKPRRPSKPSANLPAADVPTTACPQCQHRNPADATQCANCGAELSRTRDVTGEAQRLNFRPNTPDDFPAPRDMTLRLEFIDTGEVMRVPITLEQMIFGRSATGGLMPPDINLAPFDGQQKGVSRYHASLQRRGNTLLLTDLQSMNHTYINDQRLYPHEVRALKSGDKLRFGHLTMEIQILIV